MLYYGILNKLSSLQFREPGARRRIGYHRVPAEWNRGELL